jgi:signal transduction histidine kinase
MMRLSTPRSALTSWLRRARRSARLRLTALCGDLFLVSGVALLAATYVLFERATEYRAPHLPKIPHAPTIGDLQPPLAQAQQQLAQAQRQLAQAMPSKGKALPPLLQAQSHLAQRPPPGKAVAPLAQAQQQLGQAYHQLAQYPNRLVLSMKPLAQAQHQVAQAMHQVAQAMHQVAQAVPALGQAQQQLAQAQLQLSQAVHQVEQAGSVQAAQRATDSHQLLVNSAVALAIVAVLALLAGWLVAGRMLRPIRTITRTARRISSNSLHERLALDNADEEFKQLGDTLDDLFARLEAAFEAQRHFVANASHELRTPLTRERTLVHVALGDPSTSDVWRSTAQELLASNREQETLIEALLTLASSEGGLDHRERTDLADICQTLLPRPGPDTHRLGLHVETVIRSAPLDGDPMLIECLVANLVDNAIGHNVVDGHVQVSTGVNDGNAVLSVTNSGPVVPPGEVSRLFEPFQRLDGRRTHGKNGHGLGLSIVQAIATAHGAAITAAASPDGGLSVEVTFPWPTELDRVAQNMLRHHQHLANDARTRRAQDGKSAQPTRRAAMRSGCRD